MSASVINQQAQDVKVTDDTLSVDLGGWTNHFGAVGMVPKARSRDAGRT